MTKVTNQGLKYKLGLWNLSDIARSDDRVCVLNILGSESRQVTPTSHAFSGGNVVFGTSPGRGGQVLATPVGDIPVFDNVREGLAAGHAFNVGVVYLPPTAVRDGVAELLRMNDHLRKIVIVTEKISVHDAREIRAMAQARGVDVLGANSLGVADSWNRVRIGGALGGDHPEESLIKGSVSIFSNSGGFTTTIAQYLATEGWGTTTLISSGKDIYIHYDTRDFAQALRADGRTKAAVLYVEPGGYYEQDLAFDKPVVACVMGRWKSKLTRPVGHAGAMAGAGDSAADKERWFLDAFGVPEIYTPDRPVVSELGAVVTNIADIPAALTAVMARRGITPDFASRGSLALKPWLANHHKLPLPAQLQLQTVEAPAPYAEQLEKVDTAIGAQIARRRMKDKSGATRLDSESHVARIYEHSILDLALHPLATQLAVPLVHGVADQKSRDLFEAVLIPEIHRSRDQVRDVVAASRDAGNAPNTIIASAIALVGPAKVDRATRCTRKLIDLFAAAGLTEPFDDSFDFERIPQDANFAELFSSTEGDRPAASLGACSSVFYRFLERQDFQPSADAVLAAACATLAWGGLRHKRLSHVTALSLPWYIRLYAAGIAAMLPIDSCVEDTSDRVVAGQSAEHANLAQIFDMALLGKRVQEEDVWVVSMLIGLLISNGPGSISAQGAKGAVSADGPQTPERVQLNKAMIGFLSHCGYSHGGNGFEGVKFLLAIFESTDLSDPRDPHHGLNLRAMAMEFAVNYKWRKKAAKEIGETVPSLPGVHHPVFRDEQVNFDPRERFIATHMATRNEYNVFIEFYSELVRALYDVKASPNTFCVNVDGAIAALLLSLFWQDYKTGSVSPREIENGAFAVFIFGRFIGSIAEIDDHLNRGRNMDTRTDNAQCEYVI